MILLILYFFVATVIGIVFVGIRFLWYAFSLLTGVVLIIGWFRVDLYNIKRHGTLPQGLLMGTVFLMLSVLALNYTITMVSPIPFTFCLPTAV